MINNIPYILIHSFLYTDLDSLELFNNVRYFHNGRRVSTMVREIMCQVDTS